MSTKMIPFRCKDGTMINKAYIRDTLKNKDV